MKNKKGFTLVEMIGVIVLLAAIALIVYPTVTTVIKKQREKAYQIQIKKIEEAVNLYAQDNCNTKTCDSKVSIAQLKEKGYLKDEEVIDPRSNQAIDTTYSIKYNETTNKLDISVVVVETKVIESAHNYANNLTGNIVGTSLWAVSFPGATSITITFDSFSKTESCDYIYIYNKSGVQQQRLSGTTMAGKSYTITGDQIIVKLTSDGSVVYYGFKATAIAN